MYVNDDIYVCLEQYFREQNNIPLSDGHHNSSVNSLKFTLGNLYKLNNVKKTFFCMFYGEETRSSSISTMVLP